jgi:RNA polymerase sigma factor (sigma-70 family)
MGWWWGLLRHWDKDDWRAWYVRGRNRDILLTYCSLDADPDPQTGFVPQSLSTPSFEAETVKRLDAQAQLRTLSPRHRQALMLTAAGYTTEEIGLSLGVSAGRVSEMKKQARKRMGKA